MMLNEKLRYMQDQKATCMYRDAFREGGGTSIPPPPKLCTVLGHLGTFHAALKYTYLQHIQTLKYR